MGMKTNTALQRSSKRVKNYPLHIYDEMCDIFENCGEEQLT